MEVIVTSGNEPLFPRDVIVYESSFPRVVVKVDTDVRPVSSRMTNPIGSVLVTNNHGNVIAFYNRTMNLLVIDEGVSNLKDEIISKILSIADVNRKPASLSYKLFAMSMAVIASVMEDPEIVVTPDKVMVDGMEVTPDNWPQVMLDATKWSRLEEKITNYMKKIIGSGKVKVGGIIV